MNNKKTLLPIIAIILVLVLIIGGSYAWLRLTLNGTKENIIRAGNLSLELDETTSEGIRIENAVPISETKGLETTAYTFKLVNNSTIDTDVSYKIYLDDVALEDGEERMADGYIRYSLTKDSLTSPTALLDSLGVNPNRVLDSGTLSKGAEKNYELKMWIDYDADNGAQGKVFNGKLRIEAIQGNAS